MPDPLEVVAEAAELVASAKAALEAAIVAASAGGASNRAIGRVAGMSYEAVRLIVRDSTSAVDGKRARLAELDARWEAFIDALAPQFTDPDAKREQLRRNQANGKAKRKHARAEAASARRGFVGSSRLELRPTVASEARRIAETYALRFLEDHPTNPVVVKVLGELGEAAVLREEVLAVDDARVSWLTHEG